MKLFPFVLLLYNIIYSLVDATNVSSQSSPATICTVKCTIFSIDTYMIDPNENQESQFICEMDSKYENGVSGIMYSIEGLDKSSHIESGQTTLYAENVQCIKGSNAHSGGAIIVGRGNYTLQQLTAKQTTASAIGERTLLVLYAIPLDYQNNARTSVQMANEIFGICEDCVPDPANLSSQIDNCSGGKMKYIPACSRETDSCYGETDIINGVLEVPINYNISGVSSRHVANYNIAAAEIMLSKKGMTTSDFNIFHVIPDEANWGGAAAWAYSPGRVSVYRDSYAYRMGVQVHEIGHNLGFEHSGSGSLSYTDHSCLMGNPSYGDDGPLICFNGAKSWESGWYQDDSVEVDVLSNQMYNGYLVGVDDYVNGRFISGFHNVVLKIPDPSQTDDYYVMFNRKKGMNGGVSYAADKVTVVTGKSRHVSWNKAILDDFDSEFTVENFGGSTRNLTVKVCDMNYAMDASDSDTVHVLVYMDDDLNCESTSSPSSSPSAIPSTTPTMTFTPTLTPSFSPVSTQPMNDDTRLITNTIIDHDSDLIFVSHSINAAAMDAEIQFFEASCNNELGEDDIVSLDFGPFTYALKNITYGLYIDQNKLDSSETVVFDDDSSGTITFCAKLITKTTSNVDGTFEFLKFSIGFDFSNIGFTIEDVIIREQPHLQNNFEIVSSASACECNDRYECISDIYIQGDSSPEYSLCITPNVDSMFVSNLELSFESETFKYKTVGFGESGPVLDDNTVLTQSNSTLMITTTIVDEFFTDNNPFLAVRGTAHLHQKEGRGKVYYSKDIDLRVQIQRTKLDVEPHGCYSFLSKLLI